MLEKPKRYVMVRMDDEKLFVIQRAMFHEFNCLGGAFYGAVIVTESDELLTLMRFKELTMDEET